MSHIPWQSQAILNLLKEPKTIEELYDGLVAAHADSKSQIRYRVKRLYIQGKIYELEGKYYKR